MTDLIEALAGEPNDLEAPAVAIAPVDRASPRRPERAQGLPAGTHVGLGRDLLRPVRHRARRRGGRTGAAREASGLVGQGYEAGVAPS